MDCRLCDCAVMVWPTGFMDRTARNGVDSGRMSRTIFGTSVQVEAGKSGASMIMRVALFTVLLLAGCASVHDDSLATVHAVLQKDAPVQIVSITPSGDNELARLTIKNTTDRYVQTMGITWAIFRPVNCAASGSAPQIQQMTRITSIVQLPQSIWRGGNRVLKPHEKTEIKSLSLSRTELLELAKKYNAKKIRVQVGMGQVDFTTGNNFTSRNGPPDWRDENVERTNILDAEDAASAPCP